VQDTLRHRTEGHVSQPGSEGEGGVKVEETLAAPAITMSDTKKAK
jgi:hypothetical protein